MPPLERIAARRQARLWRRIRADAAAQAAAAGVAFLDCSELVPAGRHDLRCANGINMNAEGSAILGDRPGGVGTAGVPEHQLASVVERGAGGLGGRHEVAQDAGEADRVVEVREVARALEQLEPAAGHRARCARTPWAAGMIGSCSPQTSSEGIGLGEVEAVAGVDALAARVDHRAGGVHERAGGRPARPARR